MFSLPFMLGISLVTAFICLGAFITIWKYGVKPMALAFLAFFFSSLSYTLWYLLLLQQPSFLSEFGIQELAKNHDFTANFLLFLANGNAAQAIRYVSRYPVAITLFSLLTSSLAAIMTNKKRKNAIILLAEQINND